MTQLSRSRNGVSHVLFNEKKKKQQWHDKSGSRP